MGIVRLLNPLTPICHGRDEIVIIGVTKFPSYAREKAPINGYPFNHIRKRRVFYHGIKLAIVL